MNDMKRIDWAITVSEFPVIILETEIGNIVHLETRLLTSNLETFLSTWKYIRHVNFTIGV